jgi:hypothetical protein
LCKKGIDKGAREANKLCRNPARMEEKVGPSKYITNQLGENGLDDKKNL